ncbi:MAG: hypothetical protein K2X43_11580 [Hyphomonadaceae bacterium]|jgi:hypothetical protein|nr:hypothetical protein [Hyphomonadaceae bacterium]
MASAIFAFGAVMGWQFADQLLDEPATPMVAAIQFEGNRPHQPVGGEAASWRNDEAVHTPALTPRQPAAEPPQADAVARQADDERKLADALQWVDTYRQRQQAAQWEAVARHQQEMQRLAQLHGMPAHTQPQHPAGPHKVADARTGSERGAQAGRAAPTKAAHRRLAHGSHVRGRAYRAGTGPFMCPLRWLQAVLTEPAMERRSHRSYRRMAAG